MRNSATSQILDSSGNPYPTTLPISAVSLPLPTGASTETSLAGLRSDQLLYRPPHKIGPYTSQHRGFDFTTAQTGTVIWAAVASKIIVVTAYSIIASSTTDATVSIFSGTNVAADWLFRGSIDVSVNSPLWISQNISASPFVCSAANQSIQFTSSAGITISGVLYGYEADN